MDLTVNDLRTIAKLIGIKNYSRLKKHELLYLIEMYFTSKKGGSKIEKTVLTEERQRANAIERYYKGIYD